MSDLPQIASIEPWPLAARLATSPSWTPWTLVSARVGDAEEFASQLQADLSSLSENPVKIVPVGSARDLVEASREAAPVIITLLESFDGAQWRRIDTHRSRLLREQPAVVVLEESALSQVAENAPSFWSWLSGSVWQAAKPISPSR